MDHVGVATVLWKTCPKQPVIEMILSKWHLNEDVALSEILHNTLYLYCMHLLSLLYYLPTEVFFPAFVFLAQVFFFEKQHQNVIFDLSVC